MKIKWFVILMICTNKIKWLQTKLNDLNNGCCINVCINNVLKILQKISSHVISYNIKLKYIASIKINQRIVI